MSVSSPESLLKGFIENFVTEYIDENGNFPEVTILQNIAYFGSSSLPDYAEAVPGIGELVSGSVPTDNAPLNLDLNNPRTHDDDTDNTDVPLFNIIGEAITKAMTGDYEGGSPVTLDTPMEDVSDAMFHQVSSSLADANINLSSIPLYKGSTLETVGIRDGDNSDVELPADKYYEVFQDSSDLAINCKNIFSRQWHTR